ncbi:MAG TPA: phytanoyl-CoA dioxygenase family protein [Polyangiaceae bacterium]|jgi:ectoine hydroxylase-related dioxygenase (phytanoyl-CoA dioxygenase family)
MSLDPSCLENRLTTEERHHFETNGYLVVDQALSSEQVDMLTRCVDRIREKKLAEGFDPHEYFFFPNFIPEDDAFVDLIDNPRVFPKVWGILGWNIYLYHAHFVVTPPRRVSQDQKPERKGFHQDSGRVNREMEGSPRPRLSLKVGYSLEGDPAPGNGNLYIIPGAHLQNEIRYPDDGVSDPEAAMPVSIDRGDAVIFDRRLWHSASPNWGASTRKMLFYGYGYRWLRTKDDMTVQHLYPELDPIRRQILGDGVNANGHFSPTDADVPLRSWLREHSPEAAE